MNALPRALLPDTASVAADGSLVIGGCRIDELAATYGTPVFVYDEAHLRARCREAVEAFGHQRAAYATKAFLCRAMARLAYDEGMVLDVASGGELHVALAAGVPASACVLHGNNKSVAELGDALDAGVGRVVVDSFDELDRLDALRIAESRPVPDVLLRITPGVHAHTHAYIATGQDDSKFGFNLANGDAARAVERASRSPSVHLVGLHCHIGSNVFSRRQLRPRRRGDGDASPRRTSCPSSCSAAGSAWPTSRARRHRRSPNGPRSCSTPAPPPA